MGRYPDGTSEFKTGDSRKYVLPHQDSQSQPTFGNRYQQSQSIEQLKALKNTDHEESEVKRLNSLVDAQRKIISQMQLQLKAEREKNKKPQIEDLIFSPNNEMREKVPTPKAAAASNDNLDMMCDIYRQRQTEWNKIKQGRTGGTKILPSAYDVPIADSNPDLEPFINIPPRLHKPKSSKSRQRKKSKSKSKLNISMSKLSSKSGTKSVHQKSHLKVRSSRSNSKNRAKSRGEKPVVRRLSMSSMNVSLLSGQGGRKRSTILKKKPKKKHENGIDKQTRAALTKAVQDDPIKANKLISQLAGLVAEKMNMPTNAVPLKHFRPRKSIDKTVKKR